MRGAVTVKGTMGAVRALSAAALLACQMSTAVHAGPRGGTTARPVSTSRPLAYDGLTRDTLRQTKAATVFIRVDAKGGEVQGTGFFALGPGLVLTNAHVAAPDDATGRDVRVVANSGTPAERIFTGRVLVSDADADLAVVRVSGTKLPEPLALAPARGLLETMPLYIFGFPFGDGLAAKGRNPELSVLRASVACLRHTAAGRLEMIQLDGELHPGNSGGPVLDAFGRVVAITTSRLRSTRIGFAIPGERIRQLVGMSAPSATIARETPPPATIRQRAQEIGRMTRAQPGRRAARRLR